VFYHCKLKKSSSNHKKSLVHVVATLNSNMHIKFQVNRIINKGSFFTTATSKIFRENMFKV